MKEKILIVEDEPNVRKLLSDILTDRGYQIDEAADGLKGLEKLKKTNYDILITDLHMPGLDGLELIHRVQKLRPDLPCVMISGTWSTEEALDAIRRGAYDYIEKPLKDVSEVEIVVSRALEKTRLIREKKRVQRQLERVNTLLEREKAKTEDNCSSIVEQANDIIFTVDTEGKFTFLNQKWEDILGYRVASSLGQYFSPYIDEDDLSILTRAFTEAMGGKRGTTPEFRARKRDGSHRYLVVNYAPIKDEAGAVVGMLGIARDVSEQREIARSLAESEKQYRSLVDHSEDAIYILQDNKFVFTNPKFQKLLGYGLKETNAPDFDFMELVAPESRSLIRERSERTKRGQYNPPRYEFKGLSKRGELIDFEVSVVYLDYKGRPAVQGTLRDISERRKLERALRESEGKYRSLVENSSDLIYVLDDRGLFTFVNKEVVRLLGYKLEQVVGKHFSEIIHPDDLERVRRAFHERRTGERAARGLEVRLISASGIVMDYDFDFKHLEVNATGVYDDGKEFQGTYGIARDVTERRRIQHQLIQSDKLASIGQLTAGVVHEILNPLNIISGRAQLLAKREDVDPKVGKAMGIIQDQVKRIMKITDSLLQFSREKPSRMGDLAINDVLEKTLNLIDYDLRLTNIELEKKLDRTLPLILGDRDQMAQVFLTLVNNARDAMHEGGKLSILTHWEKKGGALKITISDTGVGIPPNKIGKVFDPFFTTKEVGKGTGLGLSVAYGIIKDHGGQIGVESEVGKGTTFTITLPVRESEDK